MLIAGLAPGGEWSEGTSVLWELAAEIAATKEAHHFYPVLFYMRFEDAYYSVSFVTFVLLDAVTIIRSALGDDYSSVKQLRALDQIWSGSMRLLSSLEHTFLSEKLPEPRKPGSAEQASWEQRLDRATALLEAAGLRTMERSEARTMYVELRNQWNGHVQRLAPSMLYSMKEIDRATCGV